MYSRIPQDHRKRVRVCWPQIQGAILSGTARKGTSILPALQSWRQNKAPSPAEVLRRPYCWEQASTSSTPPRSGNASWWTICVSVARIAHFLDGERQQNWAELGHTSWHRCRSPLGGHAALLGGREWKPPRSLQHHCFATTAPTGTWAI